MFSRSHGSVVLSLILIAGMVPRPCAAQKPPATPTEKLEPGRAIVQLTWGKSTSFVFPGKAGDVITLRANSKSPGLDPYVCLFDPENRVEASDDDSGKHGDSLIKDHALKQSGPYTIVVGLDNKVQGRVEVLLESTASEGGEPARRPAMVASSSQLSCEPGSPTP